jgi:hypothetical protein
MHDESASASAAHALAAALVTPPDSHRHVRSAWYCSERLEHWLWARSHPSAHDAAWVPSVAHTLEQVAELQDEGVPASDGVPFGVEDSADTRAAIDSQRPLIASYVPALSRQVRRSWKSPLQFGSAVCVAHAASVAVQVVLQF